MGEGEMGKWQGGGLRMMKGEEGLNAIKIDFSKSDVYIWSCPLYL